MATLRLRYYTCSMLAAEQLVAAEYFQQRNNDEVGELHSAGTLAGTRSSSHERTPQQTIKQSRQHLQSGMTRQVSTLNVLASSQQPKASRQNNNIALNRLINLTSTMMRKQLQSMIRNYYNNDTPISQSQHPSHSWLSGQVIYHLDHLVTTSQTE